jgi:hypothetical protein
MEALNSFETPVASVNIPAEQTATKHKNSLETLKCLSEWKGFARAFVMGNVMHL